MEKLTSKEIESRIKYLRRERLANKSYYVREADKHPAELYNFDEFLKPREVAKTQVKLACNLCQEHYPDQPELYTKTITMLYPELYRLWHFGGRIIAGPTARNNAENNLVHSFQRAGLAAEVKYYCPECVQKGIPLVGQINREKFRACGQERGVFVLSLKTSDERTMDSIPAVLFANEGVPTVDVQDCQLALRLLADNKNDKSYADFNKLFQMGHDEEARIGLVKLKVDSALRKVLNAKIEYDTREVIKSFLALRKVSQYADMELLSRIETIIVKSKDKI